MKHNGAIMPPQATTLQDMILIYRYTLPGQYFLREGLQEGNMPFHPLTEIKLSTNNYQCLY